MSWAAGRGEAGDDDGLAVLAKFRAPEGVTVDSNGLVYIADSGNCSIRVLWEEDGVRRVRTLAGQTGGGVPPAFRPGACGLTDGAGQNARFSLPTAITVGGAGATVGIYVADAGNHAIRKVTLAGAVTTLVGQDRFAGFSNGSTAQARLRNPQGIALAEFDLGWYLLVTDSANRAIRQIGLDAAGAAQDVSTRHGLSPGARDGIGRQAGLSWPYYAVTDPTGHVYVADSDEHVVRRITPTGQVTTIAGTAGQEGAADGQGAAARFRYPTGVTRDRAGNLYATDANNHTVRRLTPPAAMGQAWTVSTIAGTAQQPGAADGQGAAARFRSPEGIAVSASGKLFVADSDNHTIRQLTPPVAPDQPWTVFTIAGTAGAPGAANGQGAAARFRAPRGITMDADNNLYVTDGGNHTVRRLEPGPGLDWTVSTIAGAAGQQGAIDGQGAAARFRSIREVAVDGTSNLYVADRDNHAIRKLTPPAAMGQAWTVSTVVGQLGQRRFSEEHLPATLDQPTGVAITPRGELLVTTNWGLVMIVSLLVL